MLGALPVLKALPDVESISRHAVAVATTVAARAIVVNEQLGATERAFGLDYAVDRPPSLLERPATGSRHLGDGSFAGATSTSEA